MEIAPHKRSSRPNTRPMRVLQPFRDLLAPLVEIAHRLQALTAAVAELQRAHEQLGPGEERLALLEQSRHRFEALCEGLLLKAEGKHRAANNAEARERQMRKSYEHLIDPLDEVGEPPETPAGDSDITHNAAAGEAERLHALHLDVAPTNKTLAQRAKFGVI